MKTYIYFQKVLSWSCKQISPLKSLYEIFYQCICLQAKIIFNNMTSLSHYRCKTDQSILENVVVKTLSWFYFWVNLRILWLLYSSEQSFEWPNQNTHSPSGAILKSIGVYFWLDFLLSKLAAICFICTFLFVRFNSKFT